MTSEHPIGHGEDGSKLSASPYSVRTVVSLPHDRDIDIIEGLAIDRQGNIFVGVLSGTIIKIAPDGSQSVLTTFEFGDGLGTSAWLVGLAVDEPGNVYAALITHNQPGAATHGVWRVRPDGSKELAGAVPAAEGEPNQVALDRNGNIYLTDSLLGIVWRIAPGSKEATPWAQGPLLQPAAKVGNPCNVDHGMAIRTGCNGLAFDTHGELYVANSSQATVLRIEADPSTGTASAREHVHDCARLPSLDHIAFDVEGNLYGARNHANEIIRITPGKRIETLATTADGLNYPVNVSFGPGCPAFGTGAENRHQLYFTNLLGRTLQVLDAGVPGLPMP